MERAYGGAPSSARFSTSNHAASRPFEAEYGGVPEKSQPSARISPAPYGMRTTTACPAADAYRTVAFAGSAPSAEVLAMSRSSAGPPAKPVPAAAGWIEYAVPGGP